MKKILIIDDDLIYQKAIGMFLSASGYAVIAAENGKEGYEKAMTEKPDLIILEAQHEQRRNFEKSKKYFGWFLRSKNRLSACLRVK
ncbi:MAG: response regulator [Patescibacteria group bacterium]